MSAEFNVDQSLGQIEEQLGAKVESVVPFQNRYGMSQTLFKVEAGGASYFLKAHSANQGQEYAGYMAFKDYVPTPELRARVDSRGTDVLLFDYYPSMMMCDMVVETERVGGDFSTILAAEDRKNSALRRVYDATQRTTTFSEYLEAPVNRLFSQKLLGSVFDRYYGEEAPIRESLGAQVRLNGHLFPRTGLEIMQDIQERLTGIDPATTADSVLGHGDLHHMNVLYGADGEKVIDFEYHSQIPVAMELAKPYYIDYVGTLFFFFQQHFASHFQFDRSDLQDGILNLEINQTALLAGRVALTENKVRQFGDLIAQGRDFLSFNDYLVMCHTLSHNPNNYSADTQLLFTAMLPILAEFDYSNPASLLDPFKS